MIEVRAAFLLFLVGCSHSDTFVPGDNSVGPSGTGSDVLLTYNTEQDYWPAWTQDGKGILYAYVDQVNPPGIAHRCFGLLPATGGTRLWQLCDSRAPQGDTVSSFTAYALGADGRLLYVESVAPRTFPSFPSKITLWLADTAKPFARTALLTLPIPGLGTPAGWLSDIEWIDPSTFIALGQNYGNAYHTDPRFIPPIPTQDTLFADSILSSSGGPSTGSGVVLVGTIAGTQATVRAISGSEGATSYARTTDGATLVITKRDDLRLYKLPFSGGAATVVATVTPIQGQLVGVSCQLSSCIVASDPMLLFDGGTVYRQVIHYPTLLTGPRELRSVSLSSGAVQVVWSGGNSGPVVVTPRISPTSGDVVAQVGGVWGHLQTVSSAASNLHLYHGLIP